MQAPKVSCRLLLAATLLAPAASNAAAGTWFTVSADGKLSISREAAPQAPQVIVNFCDDTGLEVTVDTAGLEFALETTPAGSFLTAGWPECALVGEVGGPALPVVRRFFVAPQGATVVLEVREGQAVSLDLEAAGLAAPVMPIQAPIALPPEAVEPAPFRYDEAAYAAEGLLPAERVVITRLGDVRGWHLYLLEVRPLAYNPARGTLTVWPRIEALLSFEGGAGRPAGRGSLAPLNGILLNPPPARLNGRGSGNYLIITASAYAGSAPLTQLAEHKTAEGFDVTTYSVPSGTHRSAIKSYIEDLWGTADAPDYILLVGDTDGETSTSTTIPHWVGGGNKSATTDLPYACMDAGDDWYPDIAIGRFSVRSVSTLQDVADKTLCVEGGVYPDPEYTTRAAFLASNDLESGAEETHDAVIEDFMDPAGFESIRIYGAQGGNTQDVTDAVNSGCLFVVYGGHSNSSGWWGPAFYQGHVQALSNADMYPLVFGWSCNTARFDYGECFGETWLREDNKGAAAYLSASNYIYYGGNAWESSRRLEKHFFAAMFDKNIWEVSPAWQAALFTFLADPDYGPDNPVTRNMFEMFVLLGDPALHLPVPADFRLHADPVSQNLCSPPTDEAVYTIDVQPIADFEEAVTLAASGEPPEASVSFSVNPVTPPDSSVMTISNITPGSPGEYTIEITGTAGEDQQSVFVDLHLATEAPGTVSLVSPPKNATEVSRRPTLVWQPATQATEYDLEVATDSEFENIVYAVTVPETSHALTVLLEPLTDYYWHVRGVNGCGTGEFSGWRRFVTLEQDDYFTEEFDGDFDLDYFTVVFYPDGSGDYYGVCGGPVSELPTDPNGGTLLYPGEDGSESVFLEYSQTVELYGLGYTSFWVNANGNITFTGGDDDWSPTLQDHFDTPRVAALFDDLSPQNGTVSWIQLEDRAVVTYEDVPEYNSSNSNTFQVEMYYTGNGEIHITWMGIDSDSSIVGLSQGNGLPVDYVETDLSAAVPCNPVPPLADDDSVFTPVNTPVSITLTATDDGRPDPPAALTYIIVSLPSSGELSDPGAGEIDSVPYTLVGGGNQVVYTPDFWYIGTDGFTFKANDGGTPPEGGDSNIATIAIQITPPDPELVYSFTLDSDPGWTTEGQWAFGQPTGGGSHNYDPSAGHTGDNVCGYNLAGDYSIDMPAYYLTTSALDCNDLTTVELRFWRWLGVESSSFDHAAIEVSNGGPWTEVWTNPSVSIADTSWTQVVYDVSAVAAGQPSVYFRWKMGPTDSMVTYPGWNIDDIEIWAVVLPECTGDLDGDNDIDLADLSQLLAHYGMTSGAEYGDGDLDGDGDVDISDLAALLSVYGTICG